MAAGPADAFSATPRGFGCYDRELISAAADNLWSSSVVATASTGASWVDEVHSGDSVEKRIEELKRKFHRGRQLQIKQLPREVTEEEVRELLSEWEVQSVTLQSGTARVALCSPEMLEDWDRNAVFNLRGQRITIVPSPTEMLLCIGRLPLSYNDQQFHNLVATYGEIRRYFLMISEKTGESKGYGFVEYVTKEAALQAKNALDGKQLLDYTAVCDWLDSSHITVRSLHSKCLYIDHLPSNYRDMGEFRRIFSTVVNPPYCQIALRNGCPQDWGLVEFINEDDSERTQQALDGYLLHGHRIRISYYIPGVRAINLYLKLLNDGGSNKGKSALLPDPPAPAVFQQLQSLAKQNPVFAQNLQAIIMQQIQDLQKGKGVNPEHGKRQPYHKGSQVPYGAGSPNQSNSNLMKNAHQTALTLLLASQIQNGNPLTPGTPGSGQLSPNSANSPGSLQNQQLLAALQAMSKGNSGTGGLQSNSMGGNASLLNDQFLNGIPNMSNGHNLSTLLGLASGNNMNGMSQMDQQSSGSLQHGFFQSSGLLMSPGSSTTSNCSNNTGRDEQWSSYKPSKSSSNFGNNGIQKSPLLPSPSGLSSPSLDVPMDTGINPSKSPAGDPLQAVWYSLFGQPSSPDSHSASGSTSPLFMKNLMSNSSTSPSASRNVDQLFGMNPTSQSQPMRSTPPGFCGNNGGRNMNGMSGDFQEALNNLLSNPQSLCHILGGNGMSTGENPEAKSPIPFSNSSHQAQFQQGMHNGLLQQNASHMSNLQRNSPHSGGLDQGGVSSAILDLLMQSMKTDQAPSDGYNGLKHNAWSSGMSTPPSPIGNNRSFHNGHGNGHHGGPSMPQRSGSNGSSEMSSSSPRSPSYSPFPRSSNKGMLESGNGKVSPTPTPWSNQVLGSPPNSGGFGAPHHLQTHHHSANFPGAQTRNIWGNHSLSPGANSMNNNANLMNAMGQKRKVNHETGLDVEGYLQTPMGISNGISHVVLGSSTGHNTLQPQTLCNPNDITNMSSHYADTYFKKKKKN